MALRPPQVQLPAKGQNAWVCPYGPARVMLKFWSNGRQGVAQVTFSGVPGCAKTPRPQHQDRGPFPCPPNEALL
jgi:hypothetical protein